MRTLAPLTDLASLRRRYDAFLLDAYGVLVDKQGALPGAGDLIHDLNRDGCPWLVVTNSASRLPETLSAEFNALGLAIPPERILTSGALLADVGWAGDLDGVRALVLGPAASRCYAERAGAIPVHFDEDVEAEAIIIADQRDVCWPDHLDLALSLLVRRLDAGQPLRLLLCNPDLIYPVRPGRVGLTAGSLAAILEAVIRERWPDQGIGFTRLGKPSRAIFDAATRQLGATRPVMLGDQLATDIAGARAAGLDAVLVGTGLAPGVSTREARVQPTWVLPSLMTSEKKAVGVSRPRVL
ncbi:MAG: haloacid dehalogenase [Sphingobacteriia bacterium]|nr:haloacid dehalogenase [Sphingobacteriia bacterium]NCC39377.1 haloacid dehalogenase [Gammaproteobacteria bacterium]